MPDASPAKWHLAHTSWFFETMLLIPRWPDYTPLDPRYAYLFNSYYNSLGERHARPQRGLLSRPSLDEVLRYRRHVDTAMQALLDTTTDEAVAELTNLGLNHEQQHQELLLTDIQHAFWKNPLKPAYRARQLEASWLPQRQWLALDAGLHQIGHAGADFAYDNETPRHQVYLQGCAIASTLVSNAEFLQFIHDGGYTKPQLWLSDGWDWRCAEDIQAPLYWQLNDDEWQQFSLHGEQPLLAHAPVCHISYYEADAYARWAGCRLPAEAEWEACAQRHADPDLSETAPEHDPPLHPLAQGWQDQVWQWTASAYQPYPGYRTPAGAIGEYNAKFMCNQMVLRGGSCLTPPGHSRISYRNFFHPHCRWQMSGLRLARDL